VRGWGSTRRCTNGAARADACVLGQVEQLGSGLTELQLEQLVNVDGVREGIRFRWLRTAIRHS